MEDKWLLWAKRIQALAQSGLYYTKSDFEQERYQELEQISLKMLSALSEKDFPSIQQNFSLEKGYANPKIDIRAIVIQEKKILLVKEKADGCWAPPGGWADVGFSPGEMAKKETQEEAGLEVEPVRLLAIFDKKKHDHLPSQFYSYKIFIGCKIIGGKLSAGSETLDAGFFSLSDLPPLSRLRITENQIRVFFKMHEDLEAAAVFD